MSKMAIDFSGLDDMLSKLKRMQADSQAIAEEALTKGFEIITGKVEAGLHYPAGGRYSSGGTSRSMQRSPKISWKGSVGMVDVGFNIKNGGLPSIFMMYGTPRYMKVQSLYDAFYSAQTKGEVINAVKEVFSDKLGGE